MPKTKQQRPGNDWDDKARYLEDSWILHLNDDYLAFLVDKVWKLTRRCAVVDFGCGYGRFGLKFMPLLPTGSSYHGFDKSPELIAQAREFWRDSEIAHEFSIGDVLSAPYKNNHFDVAISYVVLMHLPDPARVLAEMIRVTRDGGLIITCDANRNAVNAILHMEGAQERETAPLELFQHINSEIYRRSGIDYNMGSRTPVLMHQAGLKDVGARISDSVRLLFPPIESEEKRTLLRALCDEGLGPTVPGATEREKWIESMTRYGISREDAEREIERELARDFANRAAEYHTVFTSLLTLSYGTVSKYG